VYFKNTDEEQGLPLRSINHPKLLFLCPQGDSGGPLHVANGTAHSVVGKLMFQELMHFTFTGISAFICSDR
jgi:hypothetical protein